MLNNFKTINVSKPKGKFVKPHGMGDLIHKHLIHAPLWNWHVQQLPPLPPKKTPLNMILISSSILSIDTNLRLCLCMILNY